MIYFITAIGLIFVINLFISYAIIAEENVGVVTSFGRYSRIIHPGFNMIYRWESVQRLSLQNRAIELTFQAITIDQANVHFNCTVLYSVASDDIESIKRAVFTFASNNEFEISLERLLEDETRTYVATKRQADMIGLSQEVVVSIKSRIDEKINEWGYGIEDLRYHNLKFDEVVTTSMARVVAAINEREAAEHEGHALLIRKTKEAEANGEFVRIEAEAERVAWKLRGQGLSDFRVEVSKGVHIAVKELQSGGVDPNYLLFFMYTEALKYIAENGQEGHTIFVDHNPSAPSSIIEQMSAFYRTNERLPSTGNNTCSWSKDKINH